MTATTPFHLPDLGEGVTETEIVRWLVQPGQQVAEDEPMVEVMTDKATVEIPAPTAGTVHAVHAAEGDVVPVGTMIVEIAHESAGTASGGTAPAAPEHATTPTASSRQGSAAAAATRRDLPQGSGGRIQATPLVRRIARDLGVDLAQVEGSGPGGRIQEGDVRAAAGPVRAADATAGSAEQQHAVGERRPLRGMRRAIARHLTAAARIPTVTIVEEIDVVELEQSRRKHAIGHLPYLVRACVRSFAVVPELNATFDEQRQELVLRQQVDMGIAMQADGGLVVPVLRDCAARSLQQLDADIDELARAAGAGQLTPGQTHGSSFTITSAGRFGGLFTTPLLNAPEVGILGLHRIGQRAAVVDGAVVARTMANLSLTFDHRALDGVEASRFLLAVIESLQYPDALDG